MKNLLYQITLITTLLFFGFNTNAQKLKISDGITTYQDQTRPCIIIQIEPNPKEVKGELKDWMDDEQDVNLKGFGFWRKKDVLKAEEINLPIISPNEMDFYAEVVENGDITEMKIFGSFGYNIHISKESYPTEYRAMKEMSINFLSDFLPKYYQDKIEDTQELVSDLANERNDLKEDIEENTEEISELKEENSELAEKVNETSSDMKDAAAKLKIQENKLKNINKELQAKGKIIPKEKDNK